MKTAMKRGRPLHRIEGIILKSMDYQDYDKLLHIFTKSEGLRTLLAKNANHPKFRGTLPSSPLTHAQFVFESPEKTLPLCREITPICHYLDLRKEIGRLNDACKMASTLYKALLPGKEASLLFDLFKLYLDKLVFTEGSPPLLASFLLKLLRHEGVFAFPLSCAECSRELSRFYVCEGCFFCDLHAPDKLLGFTSEEQKVLCTLMYSRQFSHILQTEVKQHLLWKIEEFYKMQRFSF